MSNSVIQVINLSKNYTISHERKERYAALRDVITHQAKKIFSFAASRQEKMSNRTSYKEKFWALKDVSFNIEQGDRVGIIGRNGAGKSTLLKILSRITEPTTGTIKIRGRVASLLEVGTGFHPELTGRENIFLNGAILGMSRLEIRKYFDEIVDFAEIEKFLDTPVKRYSSGMHVRLAFAVAAHLQPEILVVDEVLAVGDAQFQKKCLGKMEDVSKNEGRTVLFVSHNIAAVKTLCTTSILLHKGLKITQGNVLETLASYIAFDRSENYENSKFVRGTNAPAKKIFLKEAYLDLSDDLDFRLILHLKIESLLKSKIGVNIRLKDAIGFPIAYGCIEKNQPDLINISAGLNSIILKSVPLNIGSGEYKLSVELVIPGVEYLDKVEDCISFSLSNDDASNRLLFVNQSWGYGSFFIEIATIEHEVD